MMISGPLLFRADANVAMGTGHVMRCLALAQAWQDSGGRAVFSAAEMAPALEQRLSEEGIRTTRVQPVSGSLADANATIGVARETGARWIVIDGDAFGPDFLSHVRSAGFRVLLIDDFAQRESFPADLIVNPNLGATPELYRSRGSQAPLLIGESYVLLRREFTQWKQGRTLPQTGCRVLVTMGGSDPENLSPRIGDALAQDSCLEITLVAGAANPHLSELNGLWPSRVRVLFNARNMHELMAEADLAVVAAGGTLWELMYMRCGVLSYARNPVQARVVQALEQRNAARNLGYMANFDAVALLAAVRSLAHSRDLREQMTEAGRRVVDGMGADRILRAMRE